MHTLGVVILSIFRISAESEIGQMNFVYGHKHIALFINSLLFFHNPVPNKTSSSQSICLSFKKIQLSNLSWHTETKIYVLNRARALMRTILFYIQFICLVFVSTICFQLIHSANCFASFVLNVTYLVHIFQTQMHDDKKKASLNLKKHKVTASMWCIR